METMRTRWKAWRRKQKVRLRRELFQSLETKITGTLQLQMRQQIAEYQALLRRGDPLPTLEETEVKIFSQNGEDGIILFLLAMVGWERRRFLEIGIQDGGECNCANLAKHLSWGGWFVECSAHHAALARQHYATEPTTRKMDIAILNEYVTQENINELISTHGIGQVDLFSLDIDGMDWWIWKALSGVQPRIAVIEYNAAFGPERSLTVPYHARFSSRSFHPGGLYYGASLAALVRLGEEKGYRFVGCNSAGVNAFFVHNDVAPDALPAIPVDQGFRENTAQNRLAPFAQQFDTISHLDFVSV